jgi:hypothetical protein
MPFGLGPIIGTPTSGTRQLLLKVCGTQKPTPRGPMDTSSHHGLSLQPARDLWSCQEVRHELTP